jgi:hypothetical protein
MQITAQEQILQPMFSTLNSIVSHQTIGVFDSDDYSEVTAVDRSHSKKHLISANYSGEISVFNFPVFHTKQKR